MEQVPRRTSHVPLAFPCFVHCLLGVETEGLLDYQGRAGIISIVRWNLRPVIFGVEQYKRSSGKEKTHKQKQICGIVPGLGGCQNLVFVFFSGHSL